MPDLEEKDNLTGLEVAVIGMAGRFPGARNIGEFWENLKSGVESMAFFSRQELKESRIDSQSIDHSQYVPVKGFIEGVQYFDSSFFDYTPREAEIMDPQLRLYHEYCWAALEDAGYNPETYEGLIGNYTGASPSVSWLTALLAGKKGSADEFDVAVLNTGSSLSSRISYKLGLRGPAMTVQTGCSTTLVVIHLACQGLLNAECDMALAGGVSVTFPLKSGYVYQEGMIGSPDGHCRTFDHGAKGTVTGDGVGVVVLKTLEKASADGDYTYAVVKGTAVNNDGFRKAGYTVPSIEGQAEVIKAACMMAELEPESIGYVETHGTGTVLGDPIEIEGLRLAFNTDKRHFCALGSVKTNIGHLDAAAGVAGFIKVALALKERLIPPSLHFEEANPKIDFENSPFYVNTGLKEWQNVSYPLRAGVSSFGIGGTNAHVVLEEAASSRGEVDRRAYQLILCSAKTEAALERMSRNLLEYFHKNPQINLTDAAYTLQQGRKAFAYRQRVVAADIDDAVEALTGESRQRRRFFVRQKCGPLVFMFPGLGSQYVNMGRGLYEGEPVFRQEMDRCFNILNDRMGGHNIKDILYPASGKRPSSSIHRSEVAAVVIFIFEYALTRLLMNWGIEPDALIGYSFGEYAAAWLAGVFSLEHALDLVLIRGKLIHKTMAGAMLSVPLPVKELSPLLGEELSLAIDNGPSCIVSGPVEAVKKFADRLKARKCLSTPVPTDRALHSWAMEPILAEFTREVRNIPLNAPQIPYTSNVTGTWIKAEEATDPAYWSRHLRATVQFARGIEVLLSREGTVLVETGPGRDLGAMIGRYRENRPDLQVIGLVRNEARQVNDVYYLLNSIGNLWLYGVAIDWCRFHGGGKRCRLPLPTYPFDLREYPVEVDAAITGGAGEGELEVPEFPEFGPELSTPYEAPRNRLEREMSAIWQRYLGVPKVGIRDDFFELGGDSLKGLAIVLQIQQRLKAEVNVADIFDHPDVARLAACIEEAGVIGHFPVRPVEEREYYPVSSIQKRLFILGKIEGADTAYNLTNAFIIEGDLKREKFERTFAQLIHRHESFRTSFAIIDEEPVQVVHEDVDFHVNGIEADGNDIQRIVQEFITPFDLGRAPLLRAQIVRLSTERYLFLYDMHHIITDGISLAIFMRDFMRLYEGETLPESNIRYKDFCLWQQLASVRGTLEKKEAYWLDRLKGEIPKLNIYTDYPRPSVQSFAGDRIRFTFEKGLQRKIVRLMRETGTTLYMVLLTFYTILLSRYTGQEDIVVGTPVAGRERTNFEQVVGLFINALPMRNYPRGDMTFEEFLNQVKEDALRAYDNQGYPFGDLVERLGGIEDYSRHPIYEAELLVQNLHIPEWKLKGLTMTPYEYDFHTAQLDIALEAWEMEENIFFVLTYCTALFKRSTMEKFAAAFRDLVSFILKNRNTVLKDIKISHDLAVVNSNVYRELETEFEF